MMVGECLCAPVSLPSDLDDHLSEAWHDGCRPKVAEVGHSVACVETEDDVVVAALLLWSIVADRRIGQLRDV